MPKVNLPDILSGYLSAEKLNEAMEAIETALENTLSRDGSSPNQMTADLDLNGYNLLNAGIGTVTTEIMQAYVDARASGMLAQKVERQTATPGQDLFTLTTMTYNTGSNSLAVYVDGVRQFIPTDYVEVDESTVEFTVVMVGGEEVVFVSTNFLGTAAYPTVSVAWMDVSGKPATATRWPNWDEVDSKPTLYPPAAHVHSTADITSGNGLADARRGVWVQAGTPTATRVGDLWFF
jgi:hypothetical protein